jgi:hypothetical protein
MATTNAQIIAGAQLELLAAGKIRAVKDGEVPADAYGAALLADVEPIHTYAAWAKLGYQVRKGSRAVAQFTIWKYANGRQAAGDEEQNTEQEQNAPRGGRCFMKKSSFFAFSQVDRIAQA